MIQIEQIRNYFPAQIRGNSGFDKHILKEYLYITIEKYTIFQLKSIPVLIVCEDKKSYLNAG